MTDLRGASSRWYLAAALLPVALLAWSFMRLPSVFAITVAGGDATGAVGSEITLFRRGSTEIAFTARDLLQPHTGPARTAAVEAIVYAVWATGEMAGRRLGDLPWSRAVRSSLQLRDAHGKPFAGVQASELDYKLLGDFVVQLGGISNLERGAAQIFELPEGSTYRRLTGLRAICTVAIRIPASMPLSTPLSTSGPDTDLAAIPARSQELEQGLSAAFDALARSGVTRVGIGYFRTASAQTDNNWKNLLSALDHTASAHGMRRVVLGGYEPGIGGARAGAFTVAWRDWRKSLLTQRYHLVDKTARLGALVVLAAFLRAATQRRRFKSRYAVAVVFVAFGVAYLSQLVGVLQWMQLSEGVSPVPAIAQIVLAVVVGLFLRDVVAFDPKSEVQAP